jgi:hypothetical protein
MTGNRIDSGPAAPPAQVYDEHAVARVSADGRSATGAAGGAGTGQANRPMRRPQDPGAAGEAASEARARDSRTRPGTNASHHATASNPVSNGGWETLHAYQKEYEAYANQSAEDIDYAQSDADYRSYGAQAAAHGHADHTANRRTSHEKQTERDWRRARDPNGLAESLGARGRVRMWAASFRRAALDVVALLALAASKRWLRNLVLASLAAFILATAGFGLLWLRLGSGPVNIDFITPWMKAAIEEKFGTGHRVDIGGTQIERAGRVRMAVRLRDVVVRDRDNAVIASAPKADVKVSGFTLLLGRVRAEGLSLVNAGLSVRIANDGRVTISAGGAARPLASADVPIAPPGVAAPSPKSAAGAADTAPGSASGGMQGLLGMIAWLDSLSVSGLDGHALDELGFKDGSLVVDDQRSGKQSTFENVSLSLRKPRGGGVTLSVSEESPERSWLLRASVGPPVDGVRSIDVIADSVRIQDIMLAMRWSDLPVTADVPMTGRIRGEIGRDGLPTFLTGKLLGDEGLIIDGKSPGHKVIINRAEASIEWDAARRTMIAPFQILSGGNRFTLLAHLEPPNGSVPHWQLGVSGGTIVLAGGAKEEPIIFNRIDFRFIFKNEDRRVVLERADMSNGEIGIAGTGEIDYGATEPRLTLAFAGTQMSVSAFKRMWPALLVPDVRAWVMERVDRGTVNRFDLGIKAPVVSLRRDGPPVPDDGLSIDVAASAVTLRPIMSLPEMRDADIRVRVTGRAANVTANQANVETPGGRKLTLHDLVFEVPDTAMKPARARAKFRAEGGVAAATELLGMEKLAEFSDVTVDPQAARGTMSGRINLEMPLKNDLAAGETAYGFLVDVANFGADRLVMNQKLEAGALKLSGNNNGYQIKGDVKIGGQPASLDYRRTAGSPEAEIRLQTTFDDAGRSRLGVDFGSSVTGPVPVKLAGKVGTGDRESRYSLEADLTAARIDNLLPSWVKPSGRPARAVFTLLQKPNSIRLEDIVVDGSGTTIKGAAELDLNGELMSASFPTFQPSDADKASLKAERVGDGPLKVTMRGELFDGRGFVKSAVSGSDRKSRAKTTSDLDLDVKIGTVAGYYGEAMRALEVKMSRRAGLIRSFSLSGKLGRDAPLIGDLRGKAGGREVLYVETSDAGAFFRFTDTYPKIFGGQMWIAMDPPTANNTPQEGLLNVRDFVVKGEGALDRVAANGPNPGARGIEFSRMRVEFTRQPGQLAIHDGVVRGPAVGATIDGNIDYSGEQVRLRGTFVPLYGLNNIFGQIPVVGIFLGGGSNEGLLGVTYEVVGPPSAPVLRVNPISAVAPGLLRKFFEFPSGRPGQPQVPEPPQR